MCFFLKKNRQKIIMIKELCKKSLGVLVFVCGLFAVIDIYISIFEYGFSFDDVSLHEIFFLCLIFNLLFRYFCVCRGRGIKIYEFIFRPFKLIGFVNLSYISILLVFCAFYGLDFVYEFISEHERYENLHQMILFGIVALSIYVGIPKRLAVDLEKKNNN